MTRLARVALVVVLLAGSAALPHAGRGILGSQSAQDYMLGPDSQRQPAVPVGAITKYTWTGKIYPGSVHDYWIYVPAQIDAHRPACVMVFQDGASMLAETGGWRAPIVLDNLIHKGELPAIIGVFINPGVLPAASPDRQNRYNRSHEYDALDDRYARFLTDEILPEVARQHAISSDPNDRGIAGSSSGGIAAFNAAWNRPDAFRRVVSFIGSYTNLRGGDMVAGRIRKTEPKPLRVFLQDGKSDLDIYAGSWFLGNESIFSALQYAGYESTFVVGTEGHNARHGGAILPDALRWVWKDHPKPIAKPGEVNDRGVYSILEPGKEWDLLGEGYQLTADSAIDRDGSVYFTDHQHDRIHKVDPDGRITVWKEHSGGAHGIVMGQDGRLYAVQHDRKRIVAFTQDGKESVVVNDVQTHHLTVSARNELYFADAPNHRVWFVDAEGHKRVVQSDIEWPNGVRLSTDQSLLMIKSPRTKWVWSFQVQRDGSLANGEPFYRLESADDSSENGGESGVGGMAFDTEGFLYVATRLGVQVCDQPGRVVAIINPPGLSGLSNVFFAGPGIRWLYATDGERLYRRLVKRTGAVVWNPVKPPQPRL